MNTIHSFVYNVTSPTLIDKIQKSAVTLNNILDNYVLQMYEIYKTQLDNNIINRETKLVNITDPQPYVKKTILNEQYDYYI